MPEPIAFLNGRFLPVSQLAIPVYDAGLVQGVAVSEQMRSFRGRIFRLDLHLERLRRSLEIVSVEPSQSMQQLAEIAEQLVEKNAALLEPEDDLGLSLFVTPGPYPTLAPPGGHAPTTCLHTYPLPFGLWAERYEHGQHLLTTDIQQVPASCWPAELKCRSRMHYYLADRQAARQDPAARALLLDQQGRVIEASTANVVLYRAAEGVISPPRERILPGVSVAVVQELCAPLGVPFLHRDLTVEDVQAADEVMLCSTSPCLIPVVAMNGAPIGEGVPGPFFRQLLQQWSELVGMAIVEQARRFRQRRAG